MAVPSAFHAIDKVRLRGFDDEMKMVGHETPGMCLPAGFAAGLGEGFQEPHPILIVQKDGFAPVAPVHDVVNGPGILNAKFASHLRRVINEEPDIKCKK